MDGCIVSELWNRIQAGKNSMLALLHCLQAVPSQMNKSVYLTATQYVFIYL